MAPLCRVEPLAREQPAVNDPSEPNLEKLSIPELESLLAEKRRNESKRVLRAIAGRAPADPAPAGPSLRPAGLSSPETPARKGRITRRLSIDEARAALGRAGAALPGRGLYPTPAPGERFRRGGLVSISPARPQRGPAWLRDQSVRKTIDLGLQLAEVAFVLLFLYVVAQWLFADSMTDNNVAAEMAAVRPAQTATRTPTATAEVAAASVPPAATSSPLPARPTAARTPGAPPQGGAVESADEATSATTWADLDPLPGQRYHAPPTPTATASATATAADPVVATATAPAGATPTDVVETNPLLPTEIRIPRIKLDARVREVTVRLDTWEWEVADFMAGHHTGTANPGETGNVVIAGHRDIRGSVFMNLDKLKKGDDIYVRSGHGTFHYVVRTTKIVKPTAIEVMAPTTDQRLTLITCTPVKIASHRLIIIADLDTKYVSTDSGP
jgi:LPXTG-site transpeptidase (sortase) family protein